MSTLPPEASNSPQPEDNQPDESAEAPRWAVPAVPPPWAGTGQPAPDQVPAEPAPVPAQAEPAPAPVTEVPAQAEPAPAPATPAPATPPAWAQQPAQPAPKVGPPAWAQPAAGAAPQPGQPVAPQPQWGQPAQPAYGQPAQQAYGQPAWTPAVAAPQVARRPLFDRQRFMPTVVVAIVIAAVTLGGIGLDKVIAAPSAGIVNIGGSVTIHAAPGWVRVDTGSDQGVTLQNADVRLMAAGAPYDGTATAMLTEVRKSLTDQVDQIAFGEEQDGTLAGHEAALIGFEAISSGSGGGTIDGEVICLIDAGNGILFEVVAPQGSLDNAVDDIKTMAASIEVGQ